MYINWFICIYDLLATYTSVHYNKMHPTSVKTRYCQLLHFACGRKTYFPLIAAYNDTRRGESIESQSWQNISGEKLLRGCCDARLQTAAAAAAANSILRLCSQKNMHQSKQPLRDTLITSLRRSRWRRINVQDMKMLLLFAVHPVSISAGNVAKPECHHEKTPWFGPEWLKGFKRLTVSILCLRDDTSLDKAENETQWGRENCEEELELFSSPFYETNGRNFQHWLRQLFILSQIKILS